METGLQALNNAIKAGKENTGGASGGFYGYFTWKAGDKKILRFLTDDIIVGDFHEFIITNDNKTKNFLIDPNKEDYVTKYASPSPGLGWRKDFRTGGLEASKPRRSAVGAVARRGR